ncbi:TauD/TfdA dioxygenase family protein [Candidatus Uabimicrobium sp. HlEnr_7]|uniref:TauD/TfdA dioxygenase family protein n=1 Tax=Candidatus Uabimicrobium helgolandensis TaxID=3095367 RepID=UPI003557A9A6
MQNIQLETIKPFGIYIHNQGSQSITDLNRNEILDLVREHKIVLFKGFPSINKESLISFCVDDPDKELLHWDFGPVMEMQVKNDPQNYLFSREKVPFHWDGAFHTVPSFLVFHCIEAPSRDSGGETIFTNTAKIWADANKETQEKWQKISLAYETKKVAHYGGRIENKMVQPHPANSNQNILRYAEEVETELNPVSLEVVGACDKKEFLRNMTELVYNSDFCYQHVWENNDYLIVDNHAVIHGRNAFTQSSPRHLRRIQIL